MSTQTVNECPLCGAAIAGGGRGETVTAVESSSPPGHHHEDNCRKRSYRCANGHWFTLSVRNRCGAVNPDGTRCEWVGRQTCFCHPGKKVDAWPVVQWP